MRAMQVVFVCAAITIALPTLVSAEEVVTAIDETRLLQILECESPTRNLALRGMNYTLQCDEGARAFCIQSICVGVHVSEDAAKYAIRESADEIATGMTVGQRYNVGEECWSNGSVLVFRRKNVTISGKYLSDIDCALYALTRLDRMIQSDRDFAPLGQFATVPRFTDPAIPSTLVSDQPVFVNPQFEGLVSPDTVRVFIMRNTRPGSQPKEPQGDRINERGEPGERLRFQVFAVDENNVVIRAEPIQVTIVASP